MGVDCSNSINHNQVQVLGYSKYSVFLPVSSILTTGKNNQEYLLELNTCTHLSYLPTPLLGQDMTQGQFLSGV